MRYDFFIALAEPSIYLHNDTANVISLNFRIYPDGELMRDTSGPLDIVAAEKK